MSDLGEPGSYLTLDEGTAVLSSDGEQLGEVELVLADEEVDVFDGFVIDRSVLPGGHRFVDAEAVDRIYEHGVVLRIDAATAERLPEPSENPATVGVDPDDTVPDDLSDRLRRAWDVLSGRR